ncbi:MarR family transcriptional regulator [Microbacterium sp. dk485]|uniref:MarR family transcriptional regulator n=1 Tax=Microbacterium wangchenii TaxID=2541726 RepID=A0ABX5SQW2_9MICO|nr:MarR family transcriptional regulator [Microbacterium sp. EYE_512]QBR87607.1 MarR family transcriptional regulator [Microbacterium wangchenii]TFV84312.1 MarR family transcriptional regulator [Microbacterium sp. dk485]TXK15875.1 MarR family transcriptional regulator [Microbacterium wangchenii]
MPDVGETRAESSRYWYGASEEERRSRAVEVLQAFRVYRAAEIAMRRRTRESMSMGENELLVLRYLLKASGEGRSVSPSELTRYLGVSTASTTAIIDRLEKSGHVTRVPHPSDRRSILVVATAESDAEVRATLGKMHERMMSAVIDMTPEESAIVVACLARLQEAVDQVDPHGADEEPAGPLPTAI